MKIKKYICTGVVLLLTAGCTTKFEDYNMNPYQPTTVPANTLLSTMFQVYASPQQNSCQHNNTMWACFSGQVTAPQNWNKGDAIFAYYNAMDDFNGSTWGDYYGKIYANLFRIEELTEKKGVIYAVAQVTRVFAMQRMASLQGPIPYSKISQGTTAAPYDSEEVAWRAMFDDLNAAIKILEEAAKTGGNQDLAEVDQFCNGDCQKWLKFANTLKLRMAIRISGVASYAQQEAELAVKSGVMESVSDSFWDTTNSGIGVNGYNIVDSWGEVRANACLVSYMNGYKDPRRAAYFTEQKATDAGGYVGVRSGSVELPTPATYANYSRLLIATDKSAPMPVMYAAEAAFLRAEGVLKGWDMGNGSIKDFYNQGIRLSFEEFKVNGVESYLDDNHSKPGNYEDNLQANHSGNNYTNLSSVTIKWDNGDSDEIKLEKILTQKWIACFLDPMNGWADYRRTGYPRIFPATYSANTDCKVPRGQRRIRFAETEYRTNKANTESAIQMINGGRDSNGADLWWALKESEKY